MATAGAVVDRLLRRLASGARRSELPSDVDQHVGHFGRTLSRLQDVLASVERYFWVRTEVQDWMTKINRIVYDLENLLDEFEDQNGIESPRSGCITEAASLCSPCPIFLYNTRVNKMKTLRKRLDHLARNSVIFTMMQQPRCDLEQPDIEEELCRAAIVGRDSDKTKIEELMLQNNAETLCIIPIVGLVGLGKTTLARLIFYDQAEGWNFDLRIWIDLNRKFDLRKIAADIISQADETKEDGPSVVNTSVEIHENLQLLKNRLQERLHEKSCLIILDGLCSTDKSQLDELKEMLRGTNKWIKVLVTTFNEITAELMHTSPPYKLLPLSEDDCWTIFSEKAFGGGGGVNAHLNTIGKQIAKRCEGIPALAHFLGSIVHNQVMGIWLAARDEPIWKLGETFSGKTKLFSSLNQIYYDMPSALKVCFLYLPIFPKGSVIDKEKLIRQWIALDLIGSKHETLPPYVHGEMHIQDLLSIHFLQVTNTHSDGACKNTGHVVDSSGWQYSGQSSLLSLQQSPATTGLGTSIARNFFPKFNTPLGQSVEHITSSAVSMPSRETPPTSHKLPRSKMSAQIPGVRSLNLSLKQVQKATRKFSPSLKLSESALWAIYKGILPDNQIVAIRRAKKDFVLVAEVRKQAQLLAAINHWSLVRSLCYIEKGNEFIMISEYVSNGSLRQHLNGQHQILDLNQRILIAIDVAIALTYLHLSAGETLICYNLKTSKILLTESYRAKLTAFELSRSGTLDQLTGTPGYMSPEYVQRIELTSKSDVYSFGVVLLEIISSRGPLEWNREEMQDSGIFDNEPYKLQPSTATLVLAKFKSGHMKEILDDRLAYRVDEEFLGDWLSLASSCTAFEEDDRPRIEEVGERLWEIWKGHRKREGEPYRYERSWAEFVKEEGIPRGAKSIDGSSGDEEFPAKGMVTKHQDLPDVSNQQFESTPDGNYYASPIHSDITLTPPLSPR